MAADFTATATVPTASAGRYLQQLCKQWSHNMAGEFDETNGRFVFPKNARGADWPADGLFTMTATPYVLVCRIEASSPEQLEGLTGAVARHIDRFAFRASPLTFDLQ